ncbi:MAG: hypothetical protein WAT78_12020 [Rhizobiaceae bacterium]
MIRSIGSGLAARIFRASKEKTAARYEYRARISTPLERERPPSQGKCSNLKGMSKPQSFRLGLLRPGLRRARLTAFMPPRPALLAEPQNTGVQTIPIERIML